MPSRVAWGMCWLAVLGTGPVVVAQVTAALDGPAVTVATGTASLGPDPITFDSASGEYFLVWSDSRNPGEDSVYGQRISVHGDLIGANLPLVVDAAALIEPSVACDPVTDQHLVTWRHQGGAPGSAGFNHLHGLLVSPDGTGLTDPQDYSSAGFERTLVFNPAAGAEGEFFVTSRCFWAECQPGIYGQRITGSGEAAEPFQVAAGSGPPGQVALNSVTSQYLVTWGDAVDDRVKGRIVNADGSFASDLLEIGPVYSNFAPGAAFDPILNRFLVVYDDFVGGGPIRGQFVAADGSLDGEPRVLVAPPEPVGPSIAYDPVDHVFLVAWKSGRYSSRFLWARLVSITGTPLGETVQVADEHYSDWPRVSGATDRGGFVVAWPNSGSGDLHARAVAVRGGGYIFADGFASGDTTAWSPTNGSPGS